VYPGVYKLIEKFVTPDKIRVISEITPFLLELISFLTAINLAGNLVCVEIMCLRSIVM
jgi:hypothetical protein